jgi:hypothetical protein
MFRMLGVMHRMLLGVTLRGVLFMLISMQLVAVGQLRMMSGQLIVTFLMRGVGLAVMMGSGFEVMGGFFVMIVLGHGGVSSCNETGLSGNQANRLGGRRLD